LTGAVYLLDKSAGVTSRKAAGDVAKANGFSKYGHCGTLDPDATGLLVVLLGAATRLAPYISGSEKRYSFLLVTGIGTDTLDMTGNVTSRADSSGITTENVKEALGNFTGTFMQKVPLFSAVRVEGKRGYRHARQGNTPDMPERSVTVSNWENGEIMMGRIRLAATVSTGTYVRALARDIGSSLGVPAVADEIRRTMSGSFSLNEASDRPDNPESLLSMADALRGIDRMVLEQPDAGKVSHGMPVSSPATGLTALLNGSGLLLAIGVGDGNAVQPKTVFPGGEQE